jgi:Uma2 family endonuclease
MDWENDVSAIQLRRWTREEYERMIEVGVLGPADRVELLAGEIIQVTPQNSLHASGMQLAEETVRMAWRPGVVVRSQLPLALGNDSEPEPDVAIVPGQPRDYAHAHPTSALLVIEVSDTTLSYDRNHKAYVYATAQISEYWIVNLLDRRIEIYRDPLADSGAPSGAAHASRTVARPGELVIPIALPETPIAVDDLLP